MAVKTLFNRYVLENWDENFSVFEDWVVTSQVDTEYVNDELQFAILLFY